MGVSNIYTAWGLVRQGGPYNRFIKERATARGREMAGLLQRVFGFRIGQDLLVYEDPQGEHQELSWGNRIPRALEWFQRFRGGSGLTGRAGPGEKVISIGSITSKKIEFFTDFPGFGEMFP